MWEALIPFSPSSVSSSCFTPASASHTHTPTPTEQHPRGHQATTHHDPPATTVRDRTPEALNALTSVAPSAASRLQQRRDLSSFVASAASRPQPPSRLQQRRALSSVSTVSALSHFAVSFTGVVAGPSTALVTT
ncbi:hypothetical protein S83_070807, partial [Arachis hypogaea]